MTSKVDTPINAENGGVITKKDLVRMFWRSLPMEFSWHYERQMHMGFEFMVGPALKKIYKDGDTDSPDFRITPTMKEVDALIAAGADGIAIDGTKRERYDNTPLDVFIHQIKEKYPDIFLVADVSTLEEGLFCYKNGVDIIGTTLSGYTPYSKNPIKFGTIPAPDPDYELISELRKAGVEKVIAEGRINDGYKMKKCLDAGAFAVVIGTSITEPKKIVKTILNNCNERR